MIALRLVPLVTLMACTVSAPLPEWRAEPTRAQRIAAECALLEAAARRMAEAGSPAHDGLREGCPDTTARDTRPLAQQTASLRAAVAVAPPAGVLPGSRADQVFRRMITRGVPPHIATALAQERVFTAAAR